MVNHNGKYDPWEVSWLRSREVTVYLVISTSRQLQEFCDDQWTMSFPSA